jgi:CDP-diacylglycerol---glycerol-3-phosphate 3-phosphatidyltransferase
MNAALWLTASRIAAIPGLMALLLIEQTDAHRWWAIGVYFAAALTDSLDGWLARSRGQVTVAGAFLDPLADKLLVTAALLCLLQQGRVGAWAVMVIITREFAVTGLRLVAAGARLIIPASNFGKAKTVAQNLAIVAYIAPHPAGWVNAPLLYVALVLTVLSGAYYFILARTTLFAPRGTGPVEVDS